MSLYYDVQKIVVPRIVRLAREMNLGAGQAVELDCPRATLLNIAFRIRTTGTVNLFVEEHNGQEWKTTGRLEVEEGETVWHHILKKPCFRLRLANPSPADAVEVSIDANLPCLKDLSEIK
ncbi:hypothetical protein J2Z49_002762 [Desulfofundulus luciae]|uniref:Uncharacterized protein n=1 Tax=Desulfofundulus luciae TaxID=74702 RepID=A0ABU0B5V8_9FIRM|nr:hypothetical protein [Desulfofundulus luciae]MDQ0287632.1 hypothetical protein [Desulfofundulus luciae]